MVLYNLKDCLTTYPRVGRYVMPVAIVVLIYTR